MLDHADPFEAFATWYAEACRTEPDVPDAMQIATVDAQGHPRVRTVLLKDHGPEGFTFYTNVESAKGQDLRAHPHVEAVLHWKSLARQVRLAGPVSLVDKATADAYFATRPRGSQLGAWASRQSRVLDTRATLEARLANATDQFEGGPVPRPPFWSGYRIDLVRMEFWQGRADRLHDRVVWQREGAVWTHHTLYP
jgi:pyridoxamine 5'-phosphate oxidase